MNNTLLAGSTGPIPNGTITNSLLKGSYLEIFQQGSGTFGSSKFIEVFVPKFVGLVFVFGALAFFFMLVWGAISYILSGGDKAHIESARSRITNALVGFVLLIGSFALIGFIETFFGIKILSIDIGPLVIQ